GGEALEDLRRRDAQLREHRREDRLGEIAWLREVVTDGGGRDIGGPGDAQVRCTRQSALGVEQQSRGDDPFPNLRFGCGPTAKSIRAGHGASRPSTNLLTTSGRRMILPRVDRTTRRDP